MAHCIRHYEEPFVANCRACGSSFCGRCLVFSFGPRKPPYCVGCALTASGVRNNSKKVVVAAAAPPPPKADRSTRREKRARHKAMRRAGKDAVPNFAPPPPPPSRADNVPAGQVLSPQQSRYTTGNGD
jgi:hypothetical protein